MTITLKPLNLWSHTNGLLGELLQYRNLLSCWNWNMNELFSHTLLPLRFNPEQAAFVLYSCWHILPVSSTTSKASFRNSLVELEIRWGYLGAGAGEGALANKLVNKWFASTAFAASDGWKASQNTYSWRFLHRLEFGKQSPPSFVSTLQHEVLEILKPDQRWWKKSAQGNKLVKIKQWNRARGWF